MRYTNCDVCQDVVRLDEVDDGVCELCRDEGWFLIGYCEGIT